MRLKQASRRISLYDIQEEMGNSLKIEQILEVNTVEGNKLAFVSIRNRASREPTGVISIKFKISYSILARSFIFGSSILY